MKKLLLPFVLATGIWLGAADYCRIDFNGFAGRTPIAPGKSAGVVSLNSPNPTLKPYVAECRSFGNPHLVWQKTTFRATPGADGKIQLMLLANWVDPQILKTQYDGNYPRVIFRSVKALRGTAIENGNFTATDNGAPKGWRLEPGAEYKTVAIDGVNVPVIIARCYAPAIQQIQVAKDTEIELEIEWALESAFAPSARQAADDGDSYTPMAQKIVAAGRFAPHPRVLFDSGELAALRQKVAGDAYRQWRSDLHSSAEYFLTKFPASYVFPFAENPAYQLAAETLLTAWIVEGDERYARRAIDWGVAFTDAWFLKKKVPATGKFRNYIGSDPIFTLRPYALTYDILFPLLSGPEKTTFLKGLAYFGDLCAKMIENQPEFDQGLHKNYVMGQVGAFTLIACAAEGELPPAGDWLKTARRYALRFANEAIEPDGMYPEGSGYFSYTGEHLLLAFAALERQSGEKLLAGTNLARTAGWLKWHTLPGGFEYDNFSDSEHSMNRRAIPALFQYFLQSPGDRLATAAYGDSLRYHDGGAWTFLYWRKPEKAEASVATDAVFPQGGMAVFTDGDGALDAKLFFYATNYRYAAHSQADRGHFNFYSMGHIWAGDSGYANDGKEANSAAAPEAHTQVLIDGKGQSYLAGTRVSATFSRISDFATLPTLGYAEADLKSAYDYGLWYTRQGGVRPHNPVQKAARRVLFMRRTGGIPTYLLIHDDIRKDDNLHRYDWQLQLFPSTAAFPAPGGAELLPAVTGAKAVELFGAGNWFKPDAPGYLQFGVKNNGRVRFEFEAPHAGRYYLWTLSDPDHFTGGIDCAMTVNGRPGAGSGRLMLGTGAARPVWSRYSLNRNLMGEPEAVELQAGKNILEWKVMTGTGRFLRGVFTPDPGLTPDRLEGKLSADAVSFGPDHVTELANARIVELAPPTAATCRVTAIYPEKAMTRFDYFQPTRTPPHGRIHLETEAVEPDFLVMLHPRAPEMESPAITRETVDGVKIARIRWKNGTDTIALNPAGRSFALGGCRTDAKLLALRSGGDAVAVGATRLEENGKSVFALTERRTLLRADSTWRVSNFVPRPIPIDSL